MKRILFTIASFVGLSVITTTSCAVGSKGYFHLKTIKNACADPIAIMYYKGRPSYTGKGVTINLPSYIGWHDQHKRNYAKVTRLNTQHNANFQILLDGYDGENYNLTISNCSMK